MTLSFKKSGKGKFAVLKNGTKIGTIQAGWNVLHTTRELSPIEREGSGQFLASLK